jgi:hypothetical protein
MATDSGCYGFAVLAMGAAIRGQQTATAVPLGITLMLAKTDG